MSQRFFAHKITGARLTFDGPSADGDSLLATYLEFPSAETLPKTPLEIAEEASSAADETDKAITKGDAALKALVRMTPAQIAMYIGANVATLADAKQMLTKLAQVVAVLARREFK